MGSTEEICAGSGVAFADRSGLCDRFDEQGSRCATGVSMPTVGKWRSRFVESRLDGLVDEPRSGRKPTITAEQVEDVVVATLEATPEQI